MRATVSADTQPIGMDLGKWGTIPPTPRRFNSFPSCEYPLIPARSTFLATGEPERVQPAPLNIEPMDPPGFAYFRLLISPALGSDLGNAQDSVFCYLTESSFLCPRALKYLAIPYHRHGEIRLWIWERSGKGRGYRTHCPAELHSPDWRPPHALALPTYGLGLCTFYILLLLVPVHNRVQHFLGCAPGEGSHAVEVNSLYFLSVFSF